MVEILLDKVFVLVAASLVGMLCHVAKKALRGELGVASTNPFQLMFYVLLYRYLFVQNPGATVAAVLTAIAACMAIVAAGTLEALKLWPIAGLGFTTGYTCNSIANKGSV